MNQAINVCKTAVEAFTKHDIIKDVIITPNFQPSGFLSVVFPGDQAVAMGNMLGVEETQKLPTFQFISDESLASVNSEAFKPFKAGQDDLFTLVMTDPDAPSRTDKKWSEYCHYVVCDIPLHAEGDGESNFIATQISEEKGKVLQSYVGPGPPKGTGQHRYVFMLYKQPSGSSGSSFTEIKDRINWGYGTPATGVHKWATENKLELITANFFFAENA